MKVASQHLSALASSTSSEHLRDQRILSFSNVRVQCETYNRVSEEHSTMLKLVDDASMSR